MIGDDALRALLETWREQAELRMVWARENAEKSDFCLAMTNQHNTLQHCADDLAALLRGGAMRQQDED